MEYVLKTENLIKEYSHNRVVDEISLVVKQGDIYGFVGKNGAGKTTFIRLILGLANTTSGSFSLFDGENIFKARRRIGSLVESPALYNNMSAKDNLNMYCAMLGIDNKKVDEILSTVGLKDTGKKKVRDFSLGMKQRLGIGMALVGNPDFLMLDEPINGLDPTGIVEIRELLIKLKEYGKTIFISSHYLGELEKIATVYGIISKGKLIEEITAQELSKKCGKRTVIKTDNAEKAKKIVTSLLKTDNVAVGTDGSLYVRENIKDIGVITNELFKSGIVVSEISNEENSAEDYFIKKMEEN